MERLGYVRKSMYEEALARCMELEEKVDMLERKVSELESKNEELKRRLEQAASEPVMGVTMVKGIGTKRAEDLKSAGIQTVRDLAEASVKALVKASELSEEFAARLIERAKELLKGN